MPIVPRPITARTRFMGLPAAAWRYHARMYSLPKPGYDPETMRTVAVAYRLERQAGRLDEPAREAAVAAFRARHPEIERLPASEATAQIIAWAAREHSAWFWKGVSLPVVRVFCLDPCGRSLRVTGRGRTRQQSTRLLFRASGTRGC